MSIKDLLTRILKRLPRWKTFVASTNYTTTAANTWEYTNISVTVPSNHYYLVQAYCSWSSGRPLGLGMQTSNALTTTLPAPVYRWEAAVSTEALMYATFILNPGTWYLYAKRGSANVTNAYLLRGIDIYIGS